MSKDTEELKVQKKAFQEEQKDLKEGLKTLKEDMLTQQKDLREEIHTVRGEVSVQLFVEWFPRFSV